jgi:hypothetical protein
MPLLAVEALKLTNNDLVSGIVEEIIEKDETFALLPFVKTEGKAYVYNRENVLSTVDFLDPNDTVAEGAMTLTEVTTKLRILAGDVDVDNFLAGTMSTVNAQKAIQIAAKAKAMARKFKDAMVNGDSAVDTKSFDGLRKLTVAGQTIAAGANGAALTLSMLDDLLDRVLVGADAIVMRRGTIRAYRALLRATNGTDAAMIEIPNYGAPVLGFNGIPILTNDYLPSNEVQGSSGAVCTSVYAVRMNEADGFHGLYGGNDAGFVVEDVGIVQNKDATRTRIKWYTGCALKSTKSVARLSGITNT